MANIAPRLTATDPRRCVISIESTADSQRARWYDIWAAAIAIGGKCIRRGQTGIARGLGECGSQASLFANGLIRYAREACGTNI